MFFFGIWTVQATLITDKEKDTFDEKTSPDNIDDIDKNDNQPDPGININTQPFTYRNEKDITQEISPIREPVINLDVHNPLAQPIRETEPVTNPDLHTPLPSNKKRSLSTRSATDYK